MTQQLLQATGASTAAVLLLSMIGGIAHLASGIAMLKRRKWGRQLYLVVTPIVLLLSIWLYGSKLLAILLIGAAMYVAFLVLLTQRAVNDYFSDIVVEAVTEPPPQDVGKKVVSIILLALSAFILNGWFMMILPLSVNLTALVIMSAIFGVLAAALVIPAVFLWGRKRWAIVLGSLFASVGGMLLMVSVALFQVTSMPEFYDQFAKVEPVVMEQLIQGSLTFGIGSAILGGLLILLQRVSDQKPISTMT